MSFHTLIFVGNLGRNPEMRYTPEGQAVTNFSVAVDDGYMGKDGKRIDRTIWIRVSTWGKQAEACNMYLEKGRKVLVEGHLVCDPKTGGPKVWSKQDGSSGAAFEVNASTVRFLSPRGTDGSGHDAARNDAGAGGDGSHEPTMAHEESDSWESW